ncbi:MAG TPA: FRG domain-containing protein [Pyrinomonadaceae bacterium]|nr:FRG domain-containing protein [Pyrinomonadaceae bacterium]
MKEHNVDSFAKLHRVFGGYRKDNRWLFRGHSDPTWRLTPKVGRKEFAGCDDENVFRAWKRRAAEFITLPFDDDWGWLAIAQHHGLATRLLDWTFNPLAAAFFAVSEANVAEAIIFAFKSEFVVIPEKTKPFDVKGVLKFKPTGVAPRIIRQGGLFTIHEKPSRPLEEVIGKNDEIERIIINRSYRKELVFELSHYGINRATLFPDLDGLSAHVNWFTANRKYWSTTATPNPAP